MADNKISENLSQGSADEAIEPVVDDTVQEAIDEMADENDAVTEDDGAQKHSQDADAESEQITQPEIPTQVVVKRGGFFPMLMGGVAAAAIGFVAATYVDLGVWPFVNDNQVRFEAETTASLATQKMALDQLQGQFGDLAAQAGTADLKTSIAAVLADMAATKDQMAQLDAQVNDLKFRLSDLEKRPITDGISDAAIAAFEAEMKSVQDAMAAQRSEIEAQVDAAAQLEANAAISEAEAMNRAALSQIQTALDVGSGFSPAVANLTAAGHPVAPALAQIADEGVITLANLQRSFPTAARAVLDATDDGAGDGGFGAFLRNQLGARSLSPKQGDGADAVLSRAEAALDQGRLLDTLAELETLPEAGQAAMAEWIASAVTRQDALAAVEALGQQINSN